MKQVKIITAETSDMLENQINNFIKEYFDPLDPDAFYKFHLIATDIKFVCMIEINKSYPLK